MAMAMAMGYPTRQSRRLPAGMANHCEWLAIVATEEGGPRDICAQCGNWVLAPPTDPDAIGEALLGFLTDRRRWLEASRRGWQGVKRHYSWPSLVRAYTYDVRRRLEERHYGSASLDPAPAPLRMADWMLVSDLSTLVASPDEDIARLRAYRKGQRGRMAFGIS